MYFRLFIRSDGSVILSVDVKAISEGQREILIGYTEAWEKDGEILVCKFPSWETFSEVMERVIK